MNKPLLSILIPVYNTAGVLDQTLDSALAEAASVDAEVIALDDGSTDGSYELLQRRGAGLCCQRQSNQGVSAARNRLAELARGEWLLFLDADDLLLPGTLAARLQSAAQTQADAVYCDWQGFGHAEDRQHLCRAEDRALEQVAADPVLALFSGFWSPPGAWLFRAPLHEKIGGFRTDLPVIQDARYALDAALLGARLAHSAHLGLHYREAQVGSLSRRDPTKFVLDCLHNTQQIEAAFATQGRTGPAPRRALAGAFEYCARDLAVAHPALAAAAMRRALDYTDGRASRWLQAARWASAALGSERGLRWTGAVAAWRGKRRSGV